MEMPSGNCNQRCRTAHPEHFRCLGSFWVFDMETLPCGCRTGSRQPAQWPPEGEHHNRGWGCARRSLTSVERLRGQDRQGAPLVATWPAVWRCRLHARQLVDPYVEYPEGCFLPVDIGGDPW